jgi:hypothetical protein
LSTSTDRVASAAAAHSCLLLFGGAAVLSFGYVQLTGNFNGDFFGVPASLSPWTEAGLLLLSLLPYFFAWLLYKFFSRRRAKFTIAVPHRALTVTFFLLVLWFIALTLKYDVGVLGKEIYDAPAAIKPFIQISNRLNPFYLGVLFILTHRGTAKVRWTGILLLITLGILRAGLGVFLYVGLALLIRNHERLGTYLRRHRITVVAVIVIAPTFIAQMYDLRSSLRESAPSDTAMTVTEIVVARLVGRLSSYPNSTYVFQESNHFQSEVRRLDPSYYAQQALGGVIGVAFLPAVTPERMLIGVDGTDYFDVSFMVGVPGNLYLAWLIGPEVFVVNIVLMTVMSAMVFFFARRLRVRYANEFALMLLLYPLTSGVGNEFSTLATAVAAFCVLFLLINALSMQRPTTPPVALNQTLH